MAAEEPRIPPELIKELATAAIVKRKEQTKKAVAAGKRARAVKPSERALLELTKALSDFYGFAAVVHTTKDHRLMAELVAETWVPAAEYERQVQAKEEAQERVAAMQRENADLRNRIEERIKDVPRLKAAMRAAQTRLSLDTHEKHVPEEWARLLLKRVQEARQILESETGHGDSSS